jgi:hypothetical protein
MEEEAKGGKLVFIRTLTEPPIWNSADSAYQSAIVIVFPAGIFSHRSEFPAFIIRTSNDYE